MPPVSIEYESDFAPRYTLTPGDMGYNTETGLPKFEPKSPAEIQLKYDALKAGFQQDFEIIHQQHPDFRPRVRFDDAKHTIEFGYTRDEIYSILPDNGTVNKNEIDVLLSRTSNLRDEQNLLNETSGHSLGPETKPVVELPRPHITLPPDTPPSQIIHGITQLQNIFWEHYE